jgi:nucleotidyltransferase-like protein
MIAREGSLTRVPAAFTPVVEAARALIDPARVHSAYLYGSVPRGTAIPGVSDLDLLFALPAEPTPADRAEAAALGRTPSTDPATLPMLIDDLGPWLATEYQNVHGTKALRPRSAMQFDNGECET